MNVELAEITHLRRNGWRRDLGLPVEEWDPVNHRSVVVIPPESLARIMAKRSGSAVVPA